MVGEEECSGCGRYAGHPEPEGSAAVKIEIDDNLVEAASGIWKVTGWIVMVAAVGTATLSIIALEWEIFFS
jgi:hypothetical protein